MVALVVAVFAVGVVQHYNAQTMIVSNAVEAYDTVHVSEFAKRTLDGAAFAAAASVTGELAAGGGGFYKWTNETPTMSELSGKLETALGQKMDLIEFNGLLRRDITWGAANITITRYDDSGFTFSGNKPFIVKNEVSVPHMTIWNQGAFAGTVTSNYFRLLKAGRTAAVCPAKEGSAQLGGLEQNITLTENNTYSVDILDKTGGLELKFTLDCTGTKTG